MPDPSPATSMSAEGKERDLWRLPTLALWLVFLLAGLVPEEVFYSLRQLAAVPTQMALVNSPWAISFAFALYLGWFVFYRAVAGGLSRVEARGRAFQVGIIALLAFLPGVLQPLLEVKQIAVGPYRNVVYLTACGKVSAWVYLWSLVVRYYALQSDRVFAGMRSVFPSSYRRNAGQSQGVESPSKGFQKASDCPNAGEDAPEK